MAKKAFVEGEVILRERGGSSIEFYTEEFILGDEVKDINQARVIIKKAMLDGKLREKYKNYKRFRTCQVIKFENTVEKAEHSDLDKLLIRATELNCIPENLNNYKRPDFKAKALEKAIEQAEKRKPLKSEANTEDQGYVD